EVAAGARAALELLVPLGGTYMNGFVVQLRCDDDSWYFGDAVGSNSTNPGFRPVLLLSAAEPEAGAVERWSEKLSTTSLTGGGMRILTSGGRAMLTGPSTAASSNDVQVARAPFEGMPRRHGGYSSLALVVLDPEGGMPSEAQLAPLVAWVRTGGDLLVMGAGARDAARAVPELAAWMEPRFETEHLDEGSAYRCGLGR